MHLRTFAAVMTALLITAAAVGAPIEYPKTKKVRAGRRLPRHQGRRSVSLARDRRPHLEGRGRLGRRREQDHLRLPRHDSRARADPASSSPTLWNYEKYSTPYKRGGHYFFSKNNGLQNQYVVYTRRQIGGDTPRVLLDPNTWSKDGTVALGDVADQRRREVRRVRGRRGRVATGRSLACASRSRPASSCPTRSSGSSSPASPGRRTTRASSTRAFPAVEAGKAFQSLNRDQKVYYHRLGTPQSDDPVVYQPPDHPEVEPSTRTSARTAAI